MTKIQWLLGDFSWLFLVFYLRFCQSAYSEKEGFNQQSILLYNNNTTTSCVLNAVLSICRSKQNSFQNLTKFISENCQSSEGLFEPKTSKTHWKLAHGGGREPCPPMFTKLKKKRFSKQNGRKFDGKHGRIHMGCIQAKAMKD